MDSTKIKVLIVDDSFFMRKLLKDLLADDSEIEVVGEAKDGAEALGEAVRLKPDVITMDYNMPKLNGLRATVEIIKDVSPLPAIIMLSAHTIEGAKETLDCLRAGAVDYITKPSGELSLDIDRKKDEIVSKIKTASKAKIHVYPGNKEKEIIKPAKEEIKPAVKIVVIGSSTGGPPVVEYILSGLPENVKAVVVVAQHMPVNFTAEFAKRIDSISSLRTSEAGNGQVLSEGKCFISPGGLNTEIVVKPGLEKAIEISQSSGKLTPSINKLMESAAAIYGKNVLGIILTGMGEDGLKGAKAIKEAGGQIIAQDPDTAVIDSMPNAIIDAGLADYILTPKEIIDEIKKVC